MVDRKLNYQSLAVLLVAVNFNASSQDKLAKKARVSVFVYVVDFPDALPLKMYVDKWLMWF